MSKFVAIVTKVIDAVPNVDIKTALFDSYHNSTNALNEIEMFFSEFTTKLWSKNTLRVF